jgi:benzoylformate decarboxylase
MTGIEAFLEILAAAGVRYIFGNPGSTELPLNDTLVQDPRFQYVLGLQEVPLVAMADGYAMASGQLGVVNVHICCGLGNSMGMLYNAYQEGTPLLLTAGQQDRRLRVEEPVLEGDMVSVTRPWTKWSNEVQRPEDMPTAVRRAVQTALTPPTGPVFLSLPVDVQMDAADGLDLSPPHVPDRRVRPPLETLRRAAEMLADARSPAILAGCRVTEADAVAELVAVAERLGAAVWSESATSHGRLAIPAHHPLYAGALPLWSPEVRSCLADNDVVFVVGMDLLRLYIYHQPSRPIPEHVRLIQMDADPWQIGKNYPVELGLQGDPKAGLTELDGLLTEAMPTDQIQAAQERREQHAARRAAEREALDAAFEEQKHRRPMTALAFMSALGRVLPANIAVVEEAVTTHQHLLKRMGVLKDPAGHFAHRGWALGWGLGCALGVKLAWPDRPVVGLLGDGSALYGIQGLWTAAHYGMPVTFVVANNAQYKILKVCGNVMELPQMAAKKYLGMDLIEPEVDFVGLARSFGVEAHRVTEPGELSDRVRDSLADPKPILFDVRIERS